VKKFFGSRDPLGSRIGSSDSPGNFEIVGVVEDTIYQSVRWKDHLMVFVPMMQRPVNTLEPIEDDLNLYAGAIVVQTDRPMNEMETLARRTLASINPNLTIVKFQTFDAQIADQFTEERMLARLTMLFGALALLLATIGIYGVTAYTVVRRTSEIGIRMALGADRAGVIAMIMRGAVAQAGVGLIIGVPAALLGVRYVRAQLYEVTRANPTVMIIAMVTLAVATGVAGMIPARRAASTDPVQALRTE
jgi:ABC-type antimicrobial peptide transport system permease subunit